MIRDWPVQEGEFLSPHHIRASANVAVLGNNEIPAQSGDRICIETGGGFGAPPASRRKEKLFVG